MLRLCVCADIHGDLESAKELIKQLPENLDAIIIMGDIPADGAQVTSMSSIIRAFAKTKLPVYVFPGNYEYSLSYEKVMERMPKNIIDCANIKSKKINGVSCTFIPGADFLAEDASYVLVEDTPSKKVYAYKTSRENMRYIQLDKFKKHITQSSLVFTHCPPKMRGKKGIDHTFYGVAKEDFTIQIEENTYSYEKGQFLMNRFGFVEELHNLGAPITVHKKHVGYAPLTRLFTKSKAQFVFCGHIHEQGGVALTKGGKALREKTWHKQLYHNVGAIMNQRASIIEFDPDKRKARFFRLRW